jgi:hypothetical protein
MRVIMPDATTTQDRGGKFRTATPLIFFDSFS